jgi:hypothetical protein
VKNKNILGQASFPQAREGAPPHSAPLFSGTGLLQVLVCLPPPQLAVQVVHVLHPPLTQKEKKSNTMKKTKYFHTHLQNICVNSVTFLTF